MTKKVDKEKIITLFLQNPMMSAKNLENEEGITCSYQYIIRILGEAGIDYKARTERIEAFKEEELKRSLQFLYDQNVEISKMEKILNLSHTKIDSLAKELGIQLIDMRNRRKKEQIQQILMMRSQGKSFQEISNELKISYNYAINIASQAKKLQNSEMRVNN